MAFIVYDLNRGVQLGAESLIRRFAFGTEWQKIRIGILCSVNATLQTLVSTIYAPRLGVCTGNKSDLDLNPTDAIYFPFFAPSPGAFTIGGTPPVLWVYHGGGIGTQPVQKVGAASGNIGTVTTSNQALSISPYVRCPMFVDIVKGTVGSGTIDMSMWTAQNLTGSIDRSSGEFLAAMEAAAPVNTNEDAVTGTLPLRTAKDWNSMFVTWSRSYPTLTVYQMAVVRFI